MMNKFNSDFNYFIDLIKSNTNFAISRYGDGEHMIMSGEPVGYNTQAHQVDKWNYDGSNTEVSKKLIETFNHIEDNYWYAIPTQSENLKCYEYFTKLIKNNKITFANLWINSNYQQMKKFYLELDKEIYLIVNHSAKKENFPFKVAEIFPFPDDCIRYWNEYGDDYINQLIEYVSHIENKTFFISAVPISEIIIHNLYNINPNNQYIDVGSSLDEFIHGRITRPYMVVGNHYSTQISSFND